MFLFFLKHLFISFDVGVFACMWAICVLCVHRGQKIESDALEFGVRDGCR